MSKSSTDSAITFFSPHQFRVACLSLAESFRQSGSDARWTPTNASQDIRSQDSGYLLIQDRFNTCNETPFREIRTDYHILLSPTWQVPILYFAPMWSDTLEPLALDEVYTFLVEQSCKGAVEDVGVLGAISHGVLESFSKLIPRIIPS